MGPKLDSVGHYVHMPCINSAVQTTHQLMRYNTGALVDDYRYCALLLYRVAKIVPALEHDKRQHGCTAPAVRTPAGA
jgi:hypothetical protein